MMSLHELREELSFEDKSVGGTNFLAISLSPHGACRVSQCCGRSGEPVHIWRLRAHDDIDQFLILDVVCQKARLKSETTAII